MHFIMEVKNSSLKVGEDVWDEEKGRGRVEEGWSVVPNEVDVYTHFFV